MLRPHPIGHNRSTPRQDGRRWRRGSTAFPTKDSGLGMQSLSRELQAIAAVTLDPPPFPADAPRGHGEPVLVLPGLLSGDRTTARLREFLTGIGYRVETADILVNMGPTRGILAKMESRLTRLHDDAGMPVALVGVSLGGILARQLARQHPARVRAVVTLCSPIRVPVMTPLQPFAEALSPFHQTEWLMQRDRIADPLGVPVTAIYTEDDGILDWRQCLQDESAAARNVRVRGAHLSIGSNPEAQRAVAQALHLPPS